MKIAPWSLGILLILPVGFAAGQSQTPPPPPQQDAQSSSASTTLAEAAKRARDAKKDQAKPAHVWDNDTVPKASGQISVVGETPATADADNSASGAAAPADNSANGAPAAGAPAKTEGTGALKSQISDAKEKLATIKTDLDLLERTDTLDSQMYYGKPDYQTDTDGAAKLKAEQDSIAAKQQEMDDQQQKIDDLEAELGKQPAAGGEDTSNSNSN